jgi:hypothetical protein
MLIQMAKQAGRAVVSNGTTPLPPPLPEPDVADMEFFLDQVQMIFPVLSFGFLQPRPQVTGLEDADSYRVCRSSF